MNYKVLMTLQYQSGLIATDPGFRNTHRPVKQTHADVADRAL